MPSGQSHVVHSLVHTKWNCKYHIVFAPKYRRKVFYEKRRNANFWWDTYQQMYMIRANFTFKNFYALPFTKLSLDVSYC